MTTTDLAQARVDGSSAALLDWELATLGDTMAHVAQLLTYWARPTDGFVPTDAEQAQAEVVAQ